MIKSMMITMLIIFSFSIGTNIEVSANTASLMNVVFQVELTDIDNVLFNDVDDPYTIDEIQGLITANDDIDGDITHKIFVVLDNYSENTDVFGDFVVIFGVIDSGDQETQIAITVRNVDVNPPEFVLQAESTLNIPQYSLLGANLPQIKAIDLFDGDITSEVAISGLTNIDTDILGEHVLTYTVQDSFGNITSEQFTVKVVDSNSPVLTGIDEIVKRADYILDGQFFLSYFTAEDDHDGIISNRIEILDDEYIGNANVPGTYSVTVSVSDLQGNEARHTFKIKVVKDMLPHLIIDDYYWVVPNNHKFIENDFIDTLKFIDNLPNYTYVFTSTYDNYSAFYETIGTFQKNFSLLSSTGLEYQRDIILEIVPSHENIVEQEPGFMETNKNMIIGGTIFVVVLGLFFYGLSKS